MSILKSIPTNVITGFLGAGKTTGILNLLTQRPAGERWAILVNEFGEIGIDGSLFTGKETEEQGVFIREVPGGCMCCAAGLPMQIALNMLLTRAKPHRLLIEPTGLGHPQEVLAALTAAHYRDVLELHATVTMVDARKVHDERYTNHPSFNQQLAIADIIVANKADQYETFDFPALLDFLERTERLEDKTVFQVSKGAIQIDWLTAPASEHNYEYHHHEETAPPSVLQTPQMPDKGYLSIDNEGEGFYSRGWIFNATWIFDARKLYSLLLGVNTERIKGVFITDKGVTAFNKADHVLTTSDLDDAMDSRLECISADKSSFENLESALLDSVVTR
ncbi:Zinc-binding GTPase YeiR [Halioglobus japonicus]|nr:Zinc-binding GTPase YeiR [Halioglobus japonicus]